MCVCDGFEVETLINVRIARAGFRWSRSPRSSTSACTARATCTRSATACASCAVIARERLRPRRARAPRARAWPARAPAERALSPAGVQGEGPAADITGRVAVRTDARCGARSRRRRPSGDGCVDRVRAARAAPGRLSRVPSASHLRPVLAVARRLARRRLRAASRARSARAARWPDAGAARVAFAMAAACLAWTIGDLVITLESLGGATPPSPSLADAFYLAFFPLALARARALHARRDRRRRRAELARRRDRRARHGGALRRPRVPRPRAPVRRPLAERRHEPRLPGRRTCCCSGSSRGARSW